MHPRKGGFVPIAYSYIRFSTPEQSKGDSYRRQIDKSRDYATKHGLTLDENFTFKDLGRSAYRGKHATDGALGVFIAAIDEGRVESGSYLLIENLDRLSRQPPTEALQLLQSIVSRGVTVVTLADNRTYTQENLRNDPSSLLVSIIVMFRAHEESKVKGERVRAAWVKKKQQAARDGQPITRMLPAWLTVAQGETLGDTVFEVIEEKANAVRRVFDLATEEGLGQRAIVTRLKEEGIPSIGGKAANWTETSIRRILTNPAVAGIYQPMSTDKDNPSIRTPQGDPIQDYYPVIVPSAQYYEANRIRQQSLIPRGPRGEGVGSIFTGLVFCGNCGGSMRRKGASKNDTIERLRCSNTCGIPTWKYPPMELAIKVLMAHDLLPHVELKESDRKKIQKALAEARGRLQQTQDSIANLISAIQKGVDALSVQRALKDSEAKETALVKEIEALETELLSVDSRKATQESLQASVKVLAEVLREGDKEQMRGRLRYALSRSVDRIVLQDSPQYRTMRIEVGKHVRHIDFDREELSFRFRENPDFFGACEILTKSGSKKVIIP
jgi:DNA invertase Pin-like site-specific DNA recombinase